MPYTLTNEYSRGAAPERNTRATDIRRVRLSDGTWVKKEEEYLYNPSVERPPSPTRAPLRPSTLKMVQLTDGRWVTPNEARLWDSAPQNSARSPQKVLPLVVGRFVPAEIPGSSPFSPGGSTSSGRHLVAGVASKLGFVRYGEYFYKVSKTLTDHLVKGPGAVVVSKYMFPGSKTYGVTIYEGRKSCAIQLHKEDIIRTPGIQAYDVESMKGVARIGHSFLTALTSGWEDVLSNKKVKKAIASWLGDDSRPIFWMDGVEYARHRIHTVRPSSS
jgi:hypothetical protein